jgi:hypothetical protein
MTAFGRILADSILCKIALIDIHKLLERQRRDHRCIADGLEVHVPTIEAARRLHLVPSAASDVINLRIHGITIDRLLRS